MRAQFGGGASEEEARLAARTPEQIQADDEERAEAERIAQEEARPTKLQEVAKLEDKIKKGIKYVEKYADQMQDIAYECAVQEEAEPVEGKVDEGKASAWSPSPLLAARRGGRRRK